LSFLRKIDAGLLEHILDFVGNLVIVQVALVGVSAIDYLHGGGDILDGFHLTLVVDKVIDSGLEVVTVARFVRQVCVPLGHDALARATEVIQLFLGLTRYAHSGFLEHTFDFVSDFAIVRVTHGGLAGHITHNLGQLFHGLTAFLLHERFETFGVKISVALSHVVETLDEALGIGLATFTLGVGITELGRSPLYVFDFLDRYGLKIVHVGVGVFVHTVALAGLGNYQVKAVFVTANLLDESVSGVFNSGVLSQVLIVHLAETHGFERRSRLGVAVSQTITERLVTFLVLGANVYATTLQLSRGYLTHLSVGRRVVGYLYEGLF